MIEHKVFELITNIRKTPLVLSGIVLTILRQWFKGSSDSFKYDINNLETKLMIELGFDWNPENCQNRPGVYIKRGSYIPKGMGRTGMDDMLKYDVKSKTQYSIFPICQVVINCISKLPGEAEKLAWEVSDVLIAMSSMIKRDFNFMAFDVEQIGEIIKTDEYKEYFVVPISLMTKFVEAWEIEEVTPVLKNILVEAYTQLHDNLDLVI